MDKIKFLVVIIDRRLTEKLTESLTENGARLVDNILGKGSTKSEIISLLGLGETEKSVLISVVKESLVPTIFTMLKKKYHFSTPGKGLAFTIPISAVGGSTTLRLMTGETEGK